MNLVNNALKYTQNGSVCLYMAFDSESQTLRASVEDTRRGVKPELMNKIFRVFDKQEITTDFDSEGIDLSLIICKNFVHLYKGQISIHSGGTDEGCTVSFSMSASDHGPERLISDEGSN